MQRKGFTLVELSIVLVIIGLLIGGILVAQSMIATANIQSFIRQYAQLDVAVNNFRTKYNSLPGDSRVFDTAGDGDNIIENSQTNTGALTYTQLYDGEVSNFWRHLSMADFMPDKVIYSNNTAAGVDAGTHVPYAAYGAGAQKAGILIQGNTSPNSPWYWFCDVSATTTPNTDTVWNFTYSVQEIMSIEQKIDDALPRSANLNTYTGIMWVGNKAGQQCYDTGTFRYLTESTGKQCCPFISVLGSQREDLQ